MALTDDDVAELSQLERAMWRTETRGDPAWMDAHLADGFIEFGRSGRSYTRSQILDLAIGEINAELRALTVRGITSDVALVTYRSRVDGELANRASVWRRDGGWRLEFHQGATTGDDDHAAGRRSARRTARETNLSGGAGPDDG